MQLIPRITSWFSVVGSTSIVARVISNKKRRADHYHRLMLGMSIVDLLFSFAHMHFHLLLHWRVLLLGLKVIGVHVTRKGE